MITGFTHNLRAELKEVLDSVERGILGGAVRDFEEYRFLIGKKVGLEQALSVVDESVKRFDERD